MADVVAIGEILVEIMATRTGQTFREPGLLTGPYPSGAPAIFADQSTRAGPSAASPGGVDGEGRLLRRGCLRVDHHRAFGAQRGGPAADPSRAGCHGRDRLRHLPR